MFNVSGEYGQAVIYTDDVEQEAVSQIINLLNQPFAENSHVRIMSDVHAGAGCVIGYTAKLRDKIVPNLIGVDIGCGVASWHLGPQHKIGQNFDKLDRVIKMYVPSGRDVRVGKIKWSQIESVYETIDADLSFEDFKSEVTRICKMTAQDEDRAWKSLGTLGGGNHFIEVDLDSRNDLWLTIHSGSRGFGLKIAKLHQEYAERSMLSMSKEEYDTKIEEIKRTKKGKGIEVAIQSLRKEASQKGKATGLEYLEDMDAQAYYRDMHVAQIYAKLNRRLMAYEILTHRYKMDYFNPIESVHNYINFEDGIIRKGAISAHTGEKVVIPLSMADGVILGTGRGNADWNYSAPHGAGRKMSRSKAKKTIALEDFQKVMKSKNVWTSTANKSTLDEAPQAYKKAEEIIALLGDTIDIDTHMQTVYNYKDSE